MKILIILLLTFTNVLYAATIYDSKDKITNVTIFKDRAYVKRVGKIPTKKGSYSIKFDNVTPLMDTESIKVVIPQKNKAEVLSIRHKKIFLEKNKNPKVSKFEKEKEKLEKEKRNFFSQIQDLLKQDRDLGLLKKHYNDSFTLNLHTKKWSTANFNNFVSLLEKRAAQMHGEWAKLYKKYLINQKRIEFVNQKLQEMSSLSGKESYTIFIDINVKENKQVSKVDDQENEKDKEIKNISIEVQYLVNNAGWNPTYDIRVDSKQEKAIIEQHAFIRQNSGEDWNNVNVILSNVRTEIKPSIPSISSYTLSYKEVKKIKTTISNKMDTIDQLAVGGDDPSGQNMKGIAKYFKINSKQTLRDGMPQTKIFVQKVEVPYKEHLEVVASQFDKVFKKGKLINAFKFTMAPGRAALFYDGNFIQNFWQNSVTKKSPFFINAGIDYSIHVSRWYKSKNDKKGIINKDKIYKRTYTTKLKNYSKYNKKIRVLDQIPESEVAAIKVSHEGSTDGLRDIINHPSWVYWDLKLPKNATATVDLNLVVTTPEDFGFRWKD